MSKFDVIVIGAGPAGLGAVHVLTEHPDLRVLVIDAGLAPDERKAVGNDPRHTAVGSGGAALINDGKFTFGIAGTKAKLLPGFEEAVTEVAKLIGVSQEELDNHAPRRNFPSNVSEVKCSLSVQRPRPDREQLIRSIIDKAVNATFLWSSKVSSIRTEDDDDIVVVKVGEKVFASKACILATGRLAATTLNSNLPVAKDGRLEAGVRISARNSDRLFQGWGWTEKVRDPKLLILREYKDALIEIRSFCFCRDGEVVESHFDHLGQDRRVWSGVSDTAPTGMTNLGINVRVLDKSFAAKLGQPDTRSAGVTHVDNLSNIFDLNDQSPPATEWEELLQFAVNEFETEVQAIQYFAHPKPAKASHGPYEIYTWTIEGVREYFAHDPQTGFVQDCPAIVAVVGDCTGEYRGLVPAMAGGIAVTKTLVSRLTDKLAFNTLPILWARNTFSDAFMVESHVFIGPLNPDAETIARYKKDVEDYNMSKRPVKFMKAPVLSLFFRDSGHVTALQSARYVMVENERQGLQELLNDEAYWKSRGWPVLRRKLETTVHGKIKGLPDTIEDAICFGESGFYFESHIKLFCYSAERNDPSTLLPLCQSLTAKFGWPVVLSYSHTEQFDPESGKSVGVPRFINIRMRSSTVAEFLARVKLVSDEVRQRVNQTWRVEKTIDEAVIHDSWPGMDDGWINWSKTQLVVLCGARMSGKSTVCSELSARLRSHGLLSKTMRLSDVLKTEYLRLHNLPPSTFKNRAEKEKHRPALLKMLDAKNGTDPLFAARSLVAAAERWAKKFRGTIFVEDVRFPYDVEYIKKHAAANFDVCPVLLRPPKIVRIARGWVYDPKVDDHISERAFETANPANFACFDADGMTDVVESVFQYLLREHG